MLVNYQLCILKGGDSPRRLKRSGNRLRDRIELLTKACSGRLTASAGQSVAIVAGCPDARQLKRSCHDLRRSGVAVFIATDAIARTPGLKAVLSGLDSEGFQLGTTAGALALIEQEHQFLYAYQKADSTASVCVLLDGGKSALVITRKHGPCEGCLAFPGGFLRVMLETLRTCAARELKEETRLRVNPRELVLVDERSSPHRDGRGHVVDHGYLWLVGPDKQKQVLSRLEASDDAEAVHIVPVSRLVRQRMAFDHNELLEAALEIARANQGR